ncbi:hypothetical protein CMsap09_10880 [Clavibacter michiganensis]|uniref:Uncharacterized protein n=1 Tax=Clavibacter michiganensis TaxID=28447 RepID=A0A251XW89_9MICO|nr:hypothetical protein CMsap09_10880 [Clavibacter michiganensis]
MSTVLTRTLRLVAARWPALLAWYLAGWLGHYLLIQLAAELGARSALAGLLVLPLAILARLGAFIAMFLVLRDELPAFAGAAAAGRDAVDRGPLLRRGQRAADLLLVSILPFFAFYASWKLLADDTVQYATTALRRIDYFEELPVGGRVLDVALDARTVAVVGLAFAGRFLLKRYAERLPRWTALVAVYLESVWVYLTLFLLTQYQERAREWIDTRAASAWAADVRAGLTGYLEPLAVLWDGIGWVLGQVGDVVLLPIAWLTLAGVVYGRALAQAAARRRAADPSRALDRGYLRVADRVRALPGGVRRRAAEVGEDLLSRWRPLVDAVRLIWRAGVLSMGVFVLAYAVVEAGSSWLLLGAVRAIGPHDLVTWWMNVDDLLGFGVDVVLEPLRICLIAAAYDLCLRRLEERRTAAGEPSAAARESEDPRPVTA